MTILEYYFEFRNKIAKKYGYESWQEMSNRDAKIPDHVITDLVFSYAEEYHRAELLKLNKSDVISSVSESGTRLDLDKILKAKDTFKKIL